MAMAAGIGDADRVEERVIAWGWIVGSVADGSRVRALAG